MSSNAPMKPNPLTTTVMSSGTTMSMPPINATAVMVTSRAAKDAWVRSRSTPPMTASAVNWTGTTHDPVLVAPDMMPMATVWVGVAPTTLAMPATRCTRRRRRHGRLRRRRHLRHQVGVPG